MKEISLYLLVFLYVAAGINHFWHPRFYLRMIPAFVPQPGFMNQASGIAEIILGLLLLPAATRPFAAWGIITMLVLFMIIHVHMLQQARNNPKYFISPAAALIRLLLQPLLILWAYWHTY